MANRSAIGSCSALFAILLFIVFVNLCRSEERSLVLHYNVAVNNNGGVLECLSCHDDVTARMGNYQQIRLGDAQNPAGSHLIDIVYPSSFADKRNYAEQHEVVAAGLRLPDGKVVCITCHDLRLQTEHYLVLTGEGSRICFACHKL